MRNFNTNQTRHFYTKGIGGTTLELGQTATHIFLKGTNADGDAIRTDLIDKAKVEYVTLTPAANLAIHGLQHTIALKQELDALKGKTVKLKITVSQIFDYDDANNITFTVSHYVPTAKDSTGKIILGETEAQFYKAIADALKAAKPTKDKNDNEYFHVHVEEDTPTNIVLTEKPQKYVRGKLTGEPMPFFVAFGVSGASYDEVLDQEWGTDSVAKSSTVVVKANQVLADLEYFAFGERGDEFRGNNWPNNYEPTYVIDPKSTDVYDVINISYYWNGGAEMVQKSPRLLQIAIPTGTSTEDNTKSAGFKKAIDDAIANV